MLLYSNARAARHPHTSYSVFNVLGREALAAPTHKLTLVSYHIRFETSNSKTR